MTICKCCKKNKLEGQLTNKVVWNNNLQKNTWDESLNKRCTEPQFVESWTHCYIKALFSVLGGGLPQFNISDHFLGRESLSYMPPDI